MRKNIRTWNPAEVEHLMANWDSKTLDELFVMYKKPRTSILHAAFTAISGSGLPTSTVNVGYSAIREKLEASGMSKIACRKTMRWFTAPRKARVQT